MPVSNQTSSQVRGGVYLSAINLRRLTSVLRKHLESLKDGTLEPLDED
jgi:hypothetical protein